MASKIRWILLGIVVLALAVPAAFGQGETTGNITGIVKDQSGAVIPGAKVTLKNNDTGATRTQTTGPGGDYSFVSLNLGSYTLTAEASGFRRHVREKIEVHVNDRLRIDPEMQVGQVTESVTVSEQVALVSTEKPALSGLVDSQQVRELPLPNRNFMGLTLLVPGITYTGTREISLGGLSGNPMFVNGLRQTANNWLVDGSRNTDTGSNGTLFVYPSVDSIGEFRILTNAYDAEFGRNAGGMINIVTRAGTNKFHASAYEFLRNDALAARDAFQLSPIPGIGKLKAPLRYNNWGYTFGGPFYIPGLYNENKTKSFFFWSQEWRRIREFRVLSTSTVPTLQERQGIFSRAITNPATGQAFANNTIPSNLIDPNAKAFLDAGFWPAPNVGANTFRYVGSAPVNTRQELVRYDHNFKDNFRAMVRYVHDLTNGYQNDAIGIWSGSPLPDIFPNTTSTPAHNLVIKTTHILNPRMLNEVQFDYSANAIITDIRDSAKGFRSKVTGYKTGTIFPDNEAHNQRKLVPGVSISGMTAWDPGFQAYFNENPSYTFQDNFSWSRGRHDLKFGALYSREYKNEPSGGGNTPGTYTFDGRVTGVGFADFLLGRAGSYSEERTDVQLGLYYPAFEWYAQDTWKARPNLSLTFGLRYSWFSNPVDTNNLLVAFLPGLYDPAKRVTVLPNGQLAKDASGKLIGDRYNGLIFPQGAALTVAGHDSPFGRRVQSNDNNNFGPRFGFAWDPFKSGKTSVRGGYGIYYDRTLIGLVLQNGFSHPLANERISIENALLSDPRAGAPSTAVFPLSITSTDAPFITPSTQHWNLSVQRQIGPGSMVQIAYAGSGGNHLLRQYELNEPRPQAARVLNPPNTDFVRPYHGFGNIQQRATISTSRYNSLQVMWRENFQKVGLLWNTSYSWSKAISDSSDDRGDWPQDSQNMRPERGPVNYDRTHVMTNNLVWNVPFTKKWGMVPYRIFGGWEVSGILSFWTGRALTVLQTGNPLFLGRSNVLARPNVIGTPTIHNNATDRLCYIYSSANPNCAGKSGSDAFAALSSTSGFGNAGRGIIRGPGLNNWDLALFKNIPFKGEGGPALQYRLELFNAFNHINLNNPASTTLGAGTFGQVTSNYGFRIIQMGLKFTF